MGKTGETYAVGPDYLMRSDKKESTIFKKKVNTPSVKEAFSGKTEWIKTKDYRGTPVLNAYIPFKYGKLNWAIIGEVDYDEAISATKEILQLSLILLILSSIIAIVSVITAITFTRKIIKPIKILKKQIKKFQKVISQSNSM
ncbi:MULTISPECIES: hypothetical protein [unclassified Thermosipho (in: thermotogales)]|uniref:hypothetical protein n=1 Tax=unclassified Thermosipho (in: thermotogales) TaxID=2676525 RepID=UPI000986EDE9|nr:MULTISPECIES: hypothetical protein [unclassified Thermosipho (in: thermotogales)]MBT1247193.1 hypothetical protein [Thermosipho sp. 1244]OOC47431.1 hypothetical protein XO09_01445 [Thermosipho sp. 1223]